MAAARIRGSLQRRTTTAYSHCGVLNEKGYLLSYVIITQKSYVNYPKHKLFATKIK